MYKKLVLVVPPSSWLISDRDQPFTGVFYIAAFLKQHRFEVQVCDLSSLPEEHWHIPIGDIYGVTGTTPHFVIMKRIISKIKGREPGCTVVVGGVHATVMPDHLLENTEADICVVGEGEHTMLEIMQGAPLNTIDGIVTRDFSTPRRPLIRNLDTIPFPDRESVDYYSYLVPRTYSYLSDRREASVITGRGCPYNCAYCASFNIHCGKVRFRSADNVYQELRYLKDRYDIGLCNFIDDTFILNKKRVSEICDLIKPLGISWFFLTRVDRIDRDLFSKMKASGCVSVTFGFESGSNRILKVLRKNTTVEMARNAVLTAKAVGLKVRGQLMVGLPTETDGDVEATARFMTDNPEVDAFGIHFFQPFPGTDVWDNPSEYDYPLDKVTDFSTYHTIGRRGTAHEDVRVNAWMRYLLDVAGNRDIKEVQ